MGHTQKIMVAVAFLFAVGFLLVGTNKIQTPEQKEAASMIRAVAAMQGMASKKCPRIIKKHTGSQITTLAHTADSDHSTYTTIEYKGEVGDNFKLALCTISTRIGGVSKLIIDGKTIIDK